MRAFWEEFSKAVDATRDLKISDVIEALDEELGPHFFPAREDGTDPRLCPACGSGRLGLRLGRSGAFIGCSNYPECRYTRPLAVPGAEGEADGTALAEGQRELGTDPATGQAVTLRRGPYGLYVQLGEETEDAKGRKVKPRRASLPRGMDPDTLTLERALGLLSLPRVVGVHPETREEIHAAIGRFGPYVKMGNTYKSLDADDDVLSIGLNRAVALLAEAKPRGRALGSHPKDGEPVEVRRGRFGPFVQHGRRVASLPRGVDFDAVTLDQAVALLAEKGKELKPKGAARRGGAAGRAKAGSAGGDGDARGKAAAPRRRAAAAGGARKAAASAAPPGSPAARPPPAATRKAGAAKAARGRTAGAKKASARPAAGKARAAPKEAR
jgi:DNA topoisomerase-1